jgi:cell wall-associated NlpC family hydrolase
VIRTSDYFGLGFLKGGRERPAVDCWGLYRLIVGETAGVWLAEFAGTEDLRNAARVARQEAADGLGWLPVVPGTERPMDAVLMRAIVASGSRVTAAPAHIGCVVRPGELIDIEEVGGVRVRAFRNTVRLAARPDVANRVIGIYRPQVLA